MFILQDVVARLAILAIWALPYAAIAYAAYLFVPGLGPVIDGMVQ